MHASTVGLIRWSRPRIRRLSPEDRAPRPPPRRPERRGGAGWLPPGRRGTGHARGVAVALRGPQQRLTAPPGLVLGRPGRLVTVPRTHGDGPRRPPAHPRGRGVIDGRSRPRPLRGRRDRHGPPRTHRR